MTERIKKRDLKTILAITEEGQKYAERNLKEGRFVDWTDPDSIKREELIKAEFTGMSRLVRGLLGGEKITDIVDQVSEAY